jgi:RNA polymerase sigma-70 factor (ECF subfamily)
MNVNDLHERTQTEDKAAEEELFKVLSARFHLFIRQKVLNKQDVEEIVQNALTAILENYKGISFKVSFAAWAQRILENKLTDYYRSKRRHKDRFQEFTASETTADSGDPDPDFKNTLLDCLKKVNAANKRHARVLTLRYQGFRIDEICEKLGLTKNNCYSVLSRARSMLELCLEKGDVK